LTDVIIPRFAASPEAASVTREVLGLRTSIRIRNSVSYRNSSGSTDTQRSPCLKAKITQNAKHFVNLYNTRNVGRRLQRIMGQPAEKYPLLYHNIRVIKVSKSVVDMADRKFQADPAAIKPDP